MISQISLFSSIELHLYDIELNNITEIVLNNYIVLLDSYYVTKCI